MPLNMTRPLTNLPPRRGGPIPVMPSPYPRPLMAGEPPSPPSNPNSLDINPTAAPGVVNNGMGDTTPPSLRPPTIPPTQNSAANFQKAMSPDRYKGALQRKLGGPNA